MQKLKRPVSIILSILMVVSMFVAVPVTASAADYVAKIGDTGYETLEAAFAEAQDGDTITLLADCAGNGIKVTPAGKFTTGLTVDFNGYTYTVDGETVGSTGTETNGFQLLKNNKVTFTNGTITSTKAKILVQNYSNLTLEGMTLTLNNPNYTSAYTLSNNNGNIVIDDTTINANPAGGFAFDVCRYSSYPSVHVTVKGNSVINGNVEVSASGNTAKDGFSLTLESGEMYGTVVVDPSAEAAMTSTPEKATIDEKENFKFYVAKIGDNKYETLADAFAAAVDGNTITLLADCAGNGIKVTPAGKFANGLTVDFAGHTYTVDGETVGSTGTETNGFQLLKDNKVTFKNGTITSAKAKILVQNYSDLTLDKMTLTLNNPNYASGYTLSDNNGEVVINDTTINANPAGGFAFDVCRFSSYPSVHVTVTGDSVINGDVEISASSSNAREGFSLTLESGTMNGDIVLDQTAQNVIANAPDKLTITKKATFEQDAPAGYKWDNNGELVPVTYVAQIGTTKYETLEAAFAAAQDGDAITVLADCAGNGIIVPEGKFTNGLTVDFNSHKYTVDGTILAGSTGTKTQAFQLLKNNNVTFKNGTIYSEKALMLVQNYSNLTLDGMTLDGSKLVGTGRYTLSNNNGNVVIDDTTIIAKEGNNFAFDVCRYSSYPSVHVTVTGDSVINGDVEVYASGSDAKEGFSLTLESGTMNGDIVVDPSAAAAMESAPDKTEVNKKDTFTQEAPAGYKWVSNGDGTSSLDAIEYVAQIGNTKYEDLQTALNEATAGDEIVVLDNIALTGANWFVVNKDVTINLNGKTISSEDSVFVTKNGADLTVKNGTMTSSVANDYAIYVNDGSVFTLEDDATLTATNANGNGIIVRTGGQADIYGTIETGYYSIAGFGTSVVNVNDGASITSTNASAISGNGSDGNEGYTFNVKGGTLTSTNDVAIYHPNQGTLNITGGTITGKTAVYVKSGSTSISGSSTSISGATIHGTGADTPMVHSGNGCNATGDAIVIENCGYPGGTPNVSISGGTITSDNADAVASYGYNDGTTEYEPIKEFVSGGTFNTPVPKEYCATGFKPKDNGNGTYGVTKKLFVGHSVTLGGDIGVNFFINSTAANFANATSATVKFTWDGEYSKQVNLLECLKADGNYIATVDVVAAQMAHKIHAVVYINGEALAETDDYSVQDYAEAVYAKPGDYTTPEKADALKDLAKAMLNYGAEAQTVFDGALNVHPERADKNVGGAADYTGVTADDVLAAIKGEASNLTEIATQLHAKYYTNSLIYLQNNTLRIYFTPETYPADMPNAGAYDGNLSNYYYYKDKADIAAADLDNQQTFTVGNVTFKYSPLNYVADVLNSNMSPAQKDLAASLFLYNQAANAYFG